jgi:phospholipid/cholesterol/gamma-HCH transport system substrate-binding protein
MQAAAKVGFLVVVFVGLLFGAYALLGKSLFAKESEVYYAEFADAGGVTPGTRVLLAGVRVGEVESVSLEGPALARVALSLAKGTVLPEGTTAQLPTSLIGFGDNPVLLIPPDRVEGRLFPGAVLAGVRPSALEGLLPDSKETIRELNATLAATRKLMEDRELKDSLVALLESGNKTLAEFGAIARETQGLLADNRVTIQAAMNDAARAMADVRKSTEMLAKLATDEQMQGQLRTIVANLESTSKKTDDLVGEINAMVTDPELRNPMKATMANVEKMSETGTKIVENTEVMTKNGIVVSEKAVEIADKASALADEASKVLKRLQEFFDKVPDVSVKPIDVSMDLLRETRDARWRTDVNMALGKPLGDSTLHFGLYDAFEGNKVNLQLGKAFGNGSEYRYGIYASKPGVGVDFHVAPRFSLRGDWFDINNPRFDLRGRYEFGNGLVGWFGVDRLLNDNAPIIGIGIRK